MIKELPKDEFLYKNVEIYRPGRRPFAQMMVERYQAIRYGRKFFVIGLVIGLTPYIVHMNQWLK